MIYISKYRRHQCWPCRLDLDKSESLGSSERERQDREKEWNQREREQRRKWCSLVLPLLLHRFNRIQTPVSTSGSVSLPVEHVFLWFHPMLPAPHSPGAGYRYCSMRTRFAGTHRVHLIRARYARLFVSRARDCCIRKRYGILFWTVGYLLAYQRIFEYGNPFHSHSAPRRCVSPLSCKHRNFSLVLCFWAHV